MANYREIISKAVISKGKKVFTQEDILEAKNTPTTILGCWVINHQFSGIKQNNQILINGSYDINIWYSYDNDSKTNVVNKKIEYNDLFNVKVKSDNIKFGLSAGDLDMTIVGKQEDYKTTIKKSAGSCNIDNNLSGSKTLDGKLSAGSATIKFVEE